ncbi:MAG TPA: hypothetical protein VKX30_05805 [Flavobacteriaceae bacterium]|nr:hypothetical protein [Flavobacteriaceae bacterium]
MKIVTRILLWAVIAFLGWKLAKAINGPVEFNKVKEVRYAQVIEKLKDIQSAQLAYQSLNGKFIGSYDSLIQFIDTAQYAITTRRDTSFADRERNIAFGLDPEDGGYYKEEIIVDTIGFKSVRDSLFGGTDRYKRMMKLPYDWATEDIEMDAGQIERKGTFYSVFEAKVAKESILKDQDRNLLIQENQIQSVDGVNGPYIQVGDMNEINTSGNWPEFYDSRRKKD